MEAELQTFIDKSHAAKEILQQNPNDPDHIRAYREACFRLLDSILSLLKAAQPGERPSLLAVFKIGVASACEAVRTRIAETTRNQCTITRPDIVSEEFREKCSAACDTLVDTIRSYEPMYIPERLERRAPGREVLIQLQRQFDAEKQRSRQEKQFDNKSLNRLFGGRG